MPLRLFPACLAVLLMLLSAPVVAQEAGVIGTILEVEGKATVSVSGQSAVAAKVDMPVHTGDVLTTGEGARLFVLLIDDTELTLSENASMTVDEYIFDADDVAGNKARYSVLKGAFLYVSGLMTKRPDPDVTIETPYASLGIRGTTVWGGDDAGEYGIFVGDGKVDVKTDAGRVRLGKGDGTGLKGRHLAPGQVKQWSQERIGRATKTVALSRAEIIRQKIQQGGARQQALREKFKAFMKARGGEMQRPKLRQKQNAPQRREGMRDGFRNTMPDIRPDIRPPDVQPHIPNIQGGY